jgi:NADPH:quinone reductase-like Zn-dependent oxidoreductase
VNHVKVGDPIIGTFHPRWFGGPITADYPTDRLGANRDGMLAQYPILSEEALVPMPGHLFFAEAATLPCAPGTAWVALTGHRQVTGNRRRHGADAGLRERLPLRIAVRHASSMRG